MRIECDSCGAKYSIADEKVIGKLFKVRCKKCSHMIMVDGTTLGGADEPEEATRVFDANAAQAEAESSMSPSGAATAAAVWYVVIDGQQTGPLTFDEVQGHAGSGSIDAQTFAWREGMDDWLPIADIPDLAAAATAPAAAPATPSAPDPEPEDDGDFDDEATRVVSTSDDGGAFNFGGVTGGQSAIDSFSAPAPAPAPAPAAAPAASAGGDMFAGVASAASSGASAVAPSQAQKQPAAASGTGMVGERNESSVLFSLSDLTSSRSSQPKQDELPRTEGSGLIDIRVLAQAQSQVGDGAASAAPSGPAATSSAVPVTPLVPVAPRRRNTGLMVGIGIGLLVLVGLVVALVVVLTQDDPPPAPVVVADSTETGDDDEGSADEVAAAGDDDTDEPAAADEGSADAIAALDGSGEGSGDALAAAEGSGEDAPDNEGEGEGDTPAEVASATATNTAPTPPTRPSTNNSPPSRDTNSQPSRPSTDSTPPSRDTTAERPRGDDAVNSALAAIRGGDDQGSSDSGSAPTPDPEPAAAGPTELSRSQVQSTVRRYRSRLESCRSDGGARQQYDFRWVIQPSGSVTNAQARQSDDVAQCALGVIRAMQFPRFNGDAQRIPAYPMQL